jgi:hypothetical protein
MLNLLKYRYTKLHFYLLLYVCVKVVSHPKWRTYIMLGWIFKYKRKYQENSYNYILGTLINFTLH